MTKIESKLKAMEISFEQINNSRNDLIKQLGEQEIINEKLEAQVKEKTDYINSLQRRQKILIEAGKNNSKQLQKLQRFAESVKELVDSNYFDIPEYDDIVHLYESTEHTEKLKQLIEGLKDG